MCAPNACIVRRFSSLNASENTISIGWRVAAHTNASEMPVVPAVYSTTVPSGASRPSASARSIAASAMRSFMLPVGLAHSSFMKTAAAPSGTTRLSCTSGVLPMPASTPLSFLGMRTSVHQADGDEQRYDHGDDRLSRDESRRERNGVLLVGYHVPPPPHRLDHAAEEHHDDDREGHQHADAHARGRWDPPVSARFDDRQDDAD